ncbi:hypothetical protein PR048_032758 [Dryococelus australis]|uniref:Uncharacterized protein n=1 Tax=Dryococelus australis TaxID=614101 RepID=A0ABQ9G7A8_9NEOP|nr:hypothetical protein PR048_032758 [Dryococelus australis]
MKGGGTGDPRENPPTSGITRHNSHLRKSGMTRLGMNPVRLGGTGRFREFNDLQARLLSLVRTGASAVCSLAVAPHLAVMGFVRCLQVCYWLRGVQDSTSPRGGRAVIQLASHQGEPGSIPGRVTGFSRVGIVPDDAVEDNDPGVPSRTRRFQKGASQGNFPDSGYCSSPPPQTDLPARAELSPMKGRDPSETEALSSWSRCCAGAG